MWIHSTIRGDPPGTTVPLPLTLATIPIAAATAATTEEWKWSNATDPTPGDWCEFCQRNKRGVFLHPFSTAGRLRVPIFRRSGGRRIFGHNRTLRFRKARIPPHHSTSHRLLFPTEVHCQPISMRLKTTTPAVPFASRTSRWETRSTTAIIATTFFISTASWSGWELVQRSARTADAKFSSGECWSRPIRNINPRNNPRVASD
mmetsp:Transcript_17252/g.43052  ORF Transcript_17252/g.43052 Transcript_17252/m.43052 type:complete len:203 (-) Transcript_17252:265-873(-)